MYCITIFLTLLACIVTAEESHHCHANDDNPYLHFGTKSAYNFMHGELKTQQNCRPIQLFVVVRHGTRYPDLDQIPNMQKLLILRDEIISNHREKQMGHLCESDLKNLENWKLDDNVTDNMTELLTPQGENDLKGLALRLKAAFPELLTTINNSSTNDYVFRSTKTQRTEKSMSSFIERLFGNKNAVTPENVPNNDTLLRANKQCVPMRKEVRRNIFTAERNKFDNEPEMKNLIHNVSRRLGFQNNITLDSVISMYDMCRFEKAWNVDKISPWCAVFSKQEFIVLEFREDLYYYYYVGPGNRRNAILGCPLMKDLFQHFRKLEGNDFNQEPKGIFYFAHTATLQPLLTALGFNNGSQPLLATNFQESKERQWRTSFIGPFATNLVAAFYKCKNDNSTNVQNKVVFHWAERLVKYDGCTQGLCNWEYINDKLGKKADDLCVNNSKTEK
ncbi:multiple inositol polyphosphate phosphatase 1-like isoform X2 [Leptopilina heterotoma]|uniref:multiple inositol polyphosphate phosphatase 1-like isoform X2 n=1 Tax=Leptopilina heterotoma TaxID=63436 RepID=UPI001CA7D825|nr:multiple inositol polyphosphate phosphatase 1-like isoform X2 [Leptopilina heterotoma]